MSTTQNEVLGISQTVQRALQDSGYGSYMSYAGPVIEALTARETDMADKLCDYAVDAGADLDEVQAYLREIGMIVPRRENEPESEDEDDDEVDIPALSRIENSLGAIARQLESLTQFARNNGYRG